MPGASTPIENSTTRAADSGTVRHLDSPVHPNTANPRLKRSLLRAWSGLLAASLLVLLIVAARLDPSSRGLGTHQQLGLPPCTMRVIFQMRCPACGMTTSWAHFVRGEWLSSFRVNSGGFLLALYTIAVMLGSSRVAWTGTLPNQALQNRATLVLLAIALVTMLDWAGRLIAAGL